LLSSAESCQLAIVIVGRDKVTIDLSEFTPIANSARVNDFETGAHEI